MAPSSPLISYPRLHSPSRMGLANTPVSRSRRVLISLAISLTTLTAGGIFTFPMFGPIIAEKQHLSMRQTSTISSSAIVAQYLVAPFVGWLTDTKGPRVTAFLTAVLFGVGYGTMAALMNTTETATTTSTLIRQSLLPQRWVFLAISYTLTGIATSLAMFASIIASTRTFPAYPGLAIGVPSTLFGLSPIILSNVTPLFARTPDPFKGADLTTTSRPDFNVVVYFVILAIMLTVVNLFSTFALYIPSPVNHHSSVSQRQPGELDRLLDPIDFSASHDSIPSSSPSSSSSSSSWSESESSTSSIDSRSIYDKPTLVELLKTPAFWILGFIVFFLTGPSEMIISSIGSIVQSLSPESSSQLNQDAISLSVRSQHVTYISTFNTLIRVLAGSLSDSLSRRRLVNRLSWVILISLIAMISWAYTAIFITIDSLWVTSVGTALTYGIAFTLIPSILTKIWPVECLGMIWGTLLYFCAFGAAIFSIIFGIVSDYNATLDHHQHQNETMKNEPLEGLKCYGRSCISLTFIISAVGAAISTIVTWRLKVAWKGKLS